MNDKLAAQVELEMDVSVVHIVPRGTDGRTACCTTIEALKERGRQDWVSTSWEPGELTKDCQGTVRPVCPACALALGNQHVLPVTGTVTFR